MPPFIASAMALLIRAGLVARSALVGTPGRAALTGLAVGTALPGGVDIFGLGGGDGLGLRRRRRRRRRALTASDRADIAFIAGLLGTTAGKNFALTIATRTG